MASILPNKKQLIHEKAWTDFTQPSYGSELQANPITTKRFFDNLDEVGLLKQYQFTANDIYNADETGIKTVHSPGLVINVKGKKQIGRLVCAEKGELVTLVCAVSARGGVEDTRLEAKAKDTKKIRGQGQPFRGQTLSRPRTGMLEAKDQGHKRKCSSKKFFSGDLQKKVLTKIF